MLITTKVPRRSKGRHNLLLTLPPISFIPFCIDTMQVLFTNHARTNLTCREHSTSGGLRCITGGYSDTVQKRAQQENNYIPQKLPLSKISESFPFKPPRIAPGMTAINRARRSRQMDTERQAVQAKPRLPVALASSLYAHLAFTNPRAHITHPTAIPSVHTLAPIKSRPHLHRGVPTPSCKLRTEAGG